MKKLLPATWLLSAALVIFNVGCRHGSDSDRQVTDTVAAVTDTLASEPVTITFALMGDIMPGTTFPDDFLPANGGSQLLDSCRDIITSADIAAGNLEGVLLDGPGDPRPMTNPKTYFLFRIPTASLAILADAGIDFLGVANNHINDFGEPGRMSTLATLRKGKMAHAGLRDSCDYAILDRKGVKVAITQFGHGDNNLNINDIDLLRTTVGRMKKDADMVVVAFHGGAEGREYTHVPKAPEIYVGERRGNVEEFAHAAIDAGAHLVYGHGPHVPRAWEIYNGRLIIYSLGNFCTPYRMGVNGVTGYAPLAEVTVGMDGSVVEGRIHSFIQQKGRGPLPDHSNKVSDFIRDLSATDFPDSPLRIDSDGTIRIAQ